MPRRLPGVGKNCNFPFPWGKFQGLLPRPSSIFELGLVLGCGVVLSYFMLRVFVGNLLTVGKVLPCASGSEIPSCRHHKYRLMQCSAAGAVAIGGGAWLCSRRIFHWQMAPEGRDAGGEGCMCVTVLVSGLNDVRSGSLHFLLHMFFR